MYLNLNGVDTSFYVSAGAKTSGLFNSVSLRDTIKPLLMGIMPRPLQVYSDLLGLSKPAMA
jgi:hypothetical protein